MRKRLWLIAAVMLLFPALRASAQDYPRVEIFGGYSALVAGDLDDLDHVNGIGLDFAANLNRGFGLAAEFDVHKNDRSRVYSSYLGPRISFRGEHVTLFLHALAGGLKVTNLNGSPGVTVFSLAAGAGLDVNVSRSVAVRLFQLDYTPVRYRGEWINLYRGQTGVTFKLGRID
jgi:opacity protein-like surface antigen